MALDIRNFQSTTSRVYYNGITAGTNDNTLKDIQGAYIVDGYPGPAFPPVTTPADPNDQVAVISGNSSAMVLGNFAQVYTAGDRLLLAVYNGTVMEIPDFSITPPSAIVLPSTTGAPVNGPNFTVSRNDAFNSTVALSLHGDHAAPNTAFDLIPDEPPTNAAPTAGHMNEPQWSTNNFIPNKNGTNGPDAGHFDQYRAGGDLCRLAPGALRRPVLPDPQGPAAVRIGGAVRDFSLGNSDTTGEIASLGGSAALTLYVSTTNASSTRWGATGTPVSLTVDAAPSPTAITVQPRSTRASSRSRRRRSPRRRAGMAPPPP